MNIPENKESPEWLIDQNSIAHLEAELQELEDAYAECLGDNVDARTLSTLWLRIKALKRKIALSK